MSDLERTMAYQLHVTRTMEPKREHRFAPPRRWRFDFAWPDCKVALEVEGGTYTGGRHTRGSGFEKDCEKYNAATLLGWKVLRANEKMVKDGRALQVVREALGYE